MNEIPQRVLMQFIQELPKQKRLVFNLYAFGELSHKEIGEILGISERGSSSELSRARLLLMNKIKQYKEKKNQ